MRRVASQSGLEGAQTPGVDIIGGLVALGVAIAWVLVGTGIRIARIVFTEDQSS